MTDKLTISGLRLPTLKLARRELIHHLGSANVKSTVQTSFCPFPPAYPLLLIPLLSTKLPVQKTSILGAFAFIRTFLDILIEYFAQLTHLSSGITLTLSINFSKKHAMRAASHSPPQNVLRDIVLPSSLIIKILSVTGVSGLSGPTTSMSAFWSGIP